MSNRLIFFQFSHEYMKKAGDARSLRIASQKMNFINVISGLKSIVIRSEPHAQGE